MGMKITHASINDFPAPMRDFIVDTTSRATLLTGTVIGACVGAWAPWWMILLFLTVYGGVVALQVLGDYRKLKNG